MSSFKTHFLIPRCEATELYKELANEKAEEVPAARRLALSAHARELVKGVTDRYEHYLKPGRQAIILDRKVLVTDRKRGTVGAFDFKGFPQNFKGGSDGKNFLWPSLAGFSTSHQIDGEKVGLVKFFDRLIPLARQWWVDDAKARGIPAAEATASLAAHPMTYALEMLQLMVLRPRLASADIVVFQEAKKKTPEFAALATGHTVVQPVYKSEPGELAVAYDPAVFEQASMDYAPLNQLARNANVAKSETAGKQDKDEIQFLCLRHRQTGELVLVCNVHLPSSGSARQVEENTERVLDLAKKLKDFSVETNLPVLLSGDVNVPMSGQQYRVSDVAVPVAQLGFTIQTAQPASKVRTYGYTENPQLLKSGANVNVCTMASAYFNPMQPVGSCLDHQPTDPLLHFSMHGDNVDASFPFDHQIVKTKLPGGYEVACVNVLETTGEHWLFDMDHLLVDPSFETVRQKFDDEVADAAARAALAAKKAVIAAKLEPQLQTIGRCRGA